MYTFRHCLPLVTSVSSAEAAGIIIASAVMHTTYLPHYLYVMFTLF